MQLLSEKNITFIEGPLSRCLRVVVVVGAAEVRLLKRRGSAARMVTGYIILIVLEWKSFDCRDSGSDG